MELPPDHVDRMEKGEISTWSDKDTTGITNSKDRISCECSPSTGQAPEESEERFSNKMLNCFSTCGKRGIASVAELQPRKPVVRTCTDPADKTKHGYGSLTLQQ
jgi:hypothetical protein